MATNSIIVAGHHVNGDWDISEYLKRAATCVDLTLKSNAASEFDPLTPEEPDQGSHGWLRKIG